MARCAITDPAKPNNSWQRIFWNIVVVPTMMTQVFGGRCNRSPWSVSLNFQMVSKKLVVNARNQQTQLSMCVNWCFFFATHVSKKPLSNISAVNPSRAHCRLVGFLLCLARCRRLGCFHLTTYLLAFALFVAQQVMTAEAQNQSLEAALFRRWWGCWRWYYFY